MSALTFFGNNMERTDVRCHIREMNNSPFSMGWILAMFDLPVVTKKERKVATKFRNDLLDEGFLMIQFSVY